MNLNKISWKWRNIILHTFECMSVLFKFYSKYFKICKTLPFLCNWIYVLPKHGIHCVSNIAFWKRKWYYIWTRKDIKGLSNKSAWKLPKNIENMALLCRKKIERRNIYNYIFDIELVTFACPFLDCILPCFGVGTEKYFINWKLLNEI